MITPIVKAQNGRKPKLSKSANLVESPIQRKLRLAKQSGGPTTPSKSLEQEVSIKDFPYHLFPPAGAKTFDFKRLATIPKNTSTPLLLMEFKVEEAVNFVFTHYFPPI